MKRDVDLSRAILAFVEEHSPPEGGHDALAAIWNDTVWQKAKKSALEHAVPLTVGALVELVKAEFRTRLGIG